MDKYENNFGVLYEDLSYNKVTQYPQSVQATLFDHNYTEFLYRMIPVIFVMKRILFVAFCFYFKY